MYIFNPPLIEVQIAALCPKSPQTYMHQWLFGGQQVGQAYFAALRKNPWHI